MLFRSRWYTLGIVIAMGSWGLHVAALSLAPISLVQSVIAGGLVFLTVVADRLFGQTVTRARVGRRRARRRRPRVPRRDPRRLGPTGRTPTTSRRRWPPTSPRCAMLGTAVAVAAEPRRPPRRRPVRRLGGDAVGGLRRLDQGAQRTTSTTASAAVLVHPLAAVIAAALARRPAGLRAQPPDRQGGAGDRGDERRRQLLHDRGRARSSSATRCPTMRSASRCACSRSRS